MALQSLLLPEFFNGVTFVEGAEMRQYMGTIPLCMYMIFLDIARPLKHKWHFSISKAYRASTPRWDRHLALLLINGI